MTTILPNPEDDLDQHKTEELYRFLGRVERSRYTLADVEKRLMEELDAREEKT